MGTIGISLSATPCHSIKSTSCGLLFWLGYCPPQMVRREQDAQGPGVYGVCQWCWDGRRCEQGQPPLPPPKPCSSMVAERGISINSIHVLICRRLDGPLDFDLKSFRQPSFDFSSKGDGLRRGNGEISVGWHLSGVTMPG